MAGIPVGPAKALLIDGENGKEEIHRRIRAMGLRPEHASNFIAAEARGFDLREHLREVDTLVERYDPGVVLLDSYRTLWRGEERAEDEVTLSLDPIRERAHDTGKVFSMVHHAQKGGDEYRGSTAIGASVDWLVMLELVRGDDERTRRRLVTLLARFAPERPDRWLRIESEGDNGPITLTEAEPFEGGPLAPGVIERAMCAIGADGQWHSRKEVQQACCGEQGMAETTFAEWFPRVVEKPDFDETERAIPGKQGREKWWKIKS